MIKETLTCGVGRTPVGTSLDFNVMGNPFGIRKMSEADAISLIKSNGFKFKRVKLYKELISIKPIGDDDAVYNFIESLIKYKVFIFDGGIRIK